MTTRPRPSQAADGTTSTVQVVTGLEGDGYTEVLAGLEDGDTVVLPGAGRGADRIHLPRRRDLAGSAVTLTRAAAAGRLSN